MSLSIRILFLFLPLLYIPNIFNPYEFPKFIFFVVAVLILMLISMIRFWSRFAPQNDGRKMPIAFKIDTLTKLVLIYGFVVYLSDLFGIDPRTSFLGSQFRHQGFITLLSGILLFIILRAKRPEGVKSRSFVIDSSRQARTINYILLGAFLVCLVAIWQGIAFYVFHDFTIPTYQGRIVGTIGNPNSLAGYLAMVLPFALFLNRHSGKRSASRIRFDSEVLSRQTGIVPRMTSPIIRTILVVMILATILLTDSRSAFLAVGFIFLIYAIVLTYRLKLWRNIRVILFVITIVSLFILLTKNTYPPFRSPFGHLKGDLSVTNQTSIVKERGCPESWEIAYPWKIIADIYNSKIFSFTRDAPCDNRLLIWMVGLEALSKRPILGFGQENFEIAVAPGKMHNADNAHNIFLETAVSSGVIGLLLFVTIIVVAFKRASFTVKMLLIAFLIVASFNPLSIVEISLFWLLLGTVGGRGHSGVLSLRKG